MLIVGLGGLGSPASLYLAGAGVGTLGLMDGDTVEVGNLHRQIAHTEAAAHEGVTKVRSAVARCKDLNSEIRYVQHEERAGAENILGIVAQYDLVLDCTDNPATRYLISDACVVLRKVLVSGAAQRGEGMLVVLNSPPSPSPFLCTGERKEAQQQQQQQDKGPCYRCVFPRPPPPEMVRGCSEIGILGPVVGAIGTLMAGEAIKVIASGRHLLASSDEPGLHDAPLTSGSRLPPPSASSQLKGDPAKKPQQQQQYTMLLYNTYASDPRTMFRTIGLRGRRRDCLACGDDDALAQKGLERITADTISQGRLDYQAFCGVFEDLQVLDDKRRIGAKEFLELQTRAQSNSVSGHGSESWQHKGLVVDVREEHEYELGAKVAGSINIPISRILRPGSGAFEELSAELDGPNGMIGPESRVQATNSEDDSGPTRQPEQPRLVGGDVPARSQPNAAEDERKSQNQDWPPPVYFVCQRGNDSQIAAKKLLERLEADGEASHRWGWIGDVKGGFVAMEKLSLSRSDSTSS